MKRRSFLAITTGASIGFTGCLAGNDYEPCNEDVILYTRLPTEAKTEVEVALEEGVYETWNGLQYGELEGRRADYLHKDGVYYESRIESGWLGAKRILSFDEVSVSRDSNAELLLRNVRERPWNGTILIEATDGEQVLDEEVTVEPFPPDDTRDGTVSDEGDDRDRLARIPVTDEYGRYDVTFRPEDGEPEQAAFWVSMGYAPRTDRYVIGDEGIEYDETLYGAVHSPGHPPKPCSWREDGDLV